ncbi:Ig-like domain-containing protein [Candidatus Margulisiibacteriota bacterium]
MNKYSYSIYVLFLILLSVFAISGCSTYLAGSSDPAILSRSPSLGATSIASGETLTLVFNKKMNTSVNLNDAITFYNQYNTAIYPNTYESVSWSGDGKTLTILNPGEWLGGDGSRVYWIASKEGFQDENGNSIVEGTVLFNHYMSGFGIVSRTPYITEGDIYHPRTLEVTFSMTVDAGTLTPEVYWPGPSTAQIPYFFPPTWEWSADFKTFRMMVSSWSASPATAVASIEGNVESFIGGYTIPRGASGYQSILWWYGNSN